MAANSGKYIPQNSRYTPSLPPSEYKADFRFRPYISLLKVFMSIVIGEKDTRKISKFAFEKDLFFSKISIFIDMIIDFEFLIHV